MSDSDRAALVALRDRREAVIQLLTDAFAGDLVDVDTFDQRLERAHAAMTVAALDELVVDLEPPREARPSVALSRIPVGGIADRPRTVAAVFSNAERRGAWQVPSRLQARSVFGNVVLDFREATFATTEVELKVGAVFGNVEIIVPPNLAVDCEGSAVFGNFWHSEPAAADPDRPLLRVIGSAVFGNVEVQTRLPGESGREARRRTRRERKALAASARPALPPRRE